MSLKKFSFFLVLYFSFFCVYAQNSEVEKLKDKREQYLKDISNAKVLLDKKGKTRNQVLSQLTILNAQIVAQNRVIKSYRDEISQINQVISDNRKLVEELSIELNLIKEGYKRLIIEANKQFSTNYNEFMIVFSSATFSEAYRRFNLMKQYSSYRKKQGLVLIKLQTKHDSIILKTTEILNQKKSSFDLLLSEINLLKSSVQKKNVFINQLRHDEKWLMDDITKKEKFSKDLQKTIERLILDNNKKPSEFSFSNFDSAKGKLKWPVSGGIVTSYFGEHNHAVLKGVKIKNNGIDIATSKERDVRCVYEGTVTKVIAVPGYNMAIILRHGKYLTVYANMSTVYVKSGQEVKSDQKIGQIFSDSNDKSGILHFEIWKENNKINPIDWLVN